MMPRDRNALMLGGYPSLLNDQVCCVPSTSLPVSEPLMLRLLTSSSKEDVRARLQKVTCPVLRVPCLGLHQRFHLLYDHIAAWGTPWIHYVFYFELIFAFTDSETFYCCQILYNPDIQLHGPINLRNWIFYSTL